MKIERRRDLSGLPWMVTLNRGPNEFMFLCDTVGQILSVIWNFALRPYRFWSQKG